MTTETTEPDAPGSRRRARIGALLLAVVVVATACAGSDDEADSTVASLAGAEEAAAPADETELAADEELTADGIGDAVTDASAEERTDEEAMLAFAQCVRDNGVDDFPDPVTDADGNPSFDIVGSDVPIGSDELTTAVEACQFEVEGVNVGGGPAADRTEIEDTMLAFTECLRGEGLDVGDFSFDDALQGVRSGAVDPNAGRNQVLGAVLGLDPEDPVVDEAITVCEPVLDGLGQPGAA